MSNVLLISPSSNAYYTLTAPLGLSYIASQLEDQFGVYGLDLEVYRQIYQYDTKEILNLVDFILLKYNIKYVGISVLEETLPEANLIAKICKSRKICCIAGGVYPSLYPEDLSKDFQFCIRGDGELIMRDLLMHLETGNDVSDVQGISFYSIDHAKWIHIGPAGSITCKNSFLPCRHVFAKLNHDFVYSAARIITSRGCIYHCSFCTNQVFQSTYIRRDIESIVEEVKILVAEDIKEIILSDDQFLGTSEKEYREALNILIAIKPFLVKNNIRISFQVRADHWLKCIKVLPEFLQTICEISNCFVDTNEQVHNIINGRTMHGVGIDLGVESFLDRKLSYFRKGYSSQCNINCIQSLIDLPIDLGLYTILFTPDIKMEEIIKELEIFYQEYLSKNYGSKLLLANFFKELVPYKGTRIYKELVKHGELLNDRGYHFNDLRVSAFYLIITSELENMTCNPNISFRDLYTAILGFANFCRRLEPNGLLKKSLEKVVCNQQNQAKEIYSLLFNR